jgi:glutaredoxin
MTLFSTNCPQCKVLEKKLEQKGIQFEITNNIDELIEMGIKRAPILKTDDGQYLDFSNAIKYVNEVSEG